jgi:hypothetical protein
MPKMLLGDVALRCQLYMATKTSHVGVDVNRLACLLHRPMTCSRQTRGQCFMSGSVLSHRGNGWWCLSGGCKAPRLGYLVDC